MCMASVIQIFLSFIRRWSSCYIKEYYLESSSSLAQYLVVNQGVVCHHSSISHCRTLVHLRSSATAPFDLSIWSGDCPYSLPHVMYILDDYILSILLYFSFHTVVLIQYYARFYINLYLYLYT